MQEDWVHVLTANPLTLYTIRLSGEVIKELSLQGLITPVRGSRPHFTLSPLDSDERLLIHEETVCIIYICINDACFFRFTVSVHPYDIHVAHIQPVKFLCFVPIYLWFI
jgi:hypothetical protein